MLIFRASKEQVLWDSISWAGLQNNMIEKGYLSNFYQISDFKQIFLANTQKVKHVNFKGRVLEL